MKKSARNIALIAAISAILLLAACKSAAPQATPTPVPTQEVQATPVPEEQTPEPPENAEQDEKEYAFAREDFPAFETTDIDGNTMDNSVFADAKVTMVNMWATWCGPCIYELPDLQRLSVDYADRGFKLIGIFDYSSTDNEVRGLMDGNGLTYTMAHYSDTFFLLETGYVPTTYFVDGSGRIMGEAHVGANSYEGWSEVIDELLKDVD